MKIVIMRRAHIHYWPVWSSGIGRCMHTPDIIIKSGNGSPIRSSSRPHDYSGPALKRTPSVMITRHHLALTLICVLFPCTVIAGTRPDLLLFVLAGAGIGAILPDIHMKRPSKIRFLTGAWLLVQTGRKTVVPVMCRLYRFLLGIRPSPDDKRLTHSIPGTIVFAILYTSPALAVGILLSGHPVGLALLAFSSGIFMGMIIHLTQDLCTRKGIVPLYPFSEILIRGSIRPCDLHDPRIFRFHIQHIAILFVFQIALFLATLPAPAILPFAFLCTTLCIVLMIWQSEVHIGRDANQPPLSG